MYGEEVIEFSCFGDCFVGRYQWSEFAGIESFPRKSIWRGKVMRCQFGRSIPTE